LLRKLKDVDPKELNKAAKEQMLEYLKKLWEDRQTFHEMKAHALPSVKIQKAKL
jgi:hypothetical protein